MSKKAVVLLSGGMDSATTLAIAKEQGYQCYAISFDYGQRSIAELNAAKKVAKSVGVISHQILELPIGSLGGSSLTDFSLDIPESADDAQAIPNTYVPARNTIFLSFALGFAESIGASTIFIGASSVDYSGYPDCRPEYFKAFQEMATLATKQGVEGSSFEIKTPLLHLSKAETIQKGLSLSLDYRLTVSCYQSDANGLACGKCDSCALRKKGFEDLGVEDATLYQDAEIQSYPTRSKIQTAQKMLASGHEIYSHEAMSQAVDKLANEITEAFANEYPLLICVMQGAVVFTGMLLTRLHFPLQLDYLHATRYGDNASGQTLKWMVKPQVDMRDRTVIIVDDIIDGGVTLSEIVAYCKARGARSVKTAVLVDKNREREVKGGMHADFVGLEIDDVFVCGYGMDYKEFWRNAPGLCAIGEHDE